MNVEITCVNNSNIACVLFLSLELENLGVNGEILNYKSQPFQCWIYCISVYNSCLDLTS